MTWILFKNIPPEWYGIDKGKWEKEQERILWSRRILGKEQLEDALKHGAKIIEENKDGTILVEEPSIKQDTAGKLFKNINKEKVDNLLLKEFLKALNLERKDIQTPIISYYSTFEEGKITANFVVLENGEKKIKTETRTVKIGSGEIIFLIGLVQPIKGLLSISYRRKDDGFFKLENIVLTYKAEREKESIDLKFPKEFKIEITPFLSVH